MSSEQMKWSQLVDQIVANARAYDKGKIAVKEYSDNYRRLTAELAAEIQSKPYDKTIPSPPTKPESEWVKSVEQSRQEWNDTCGQPCTDELCRKEHNHNNAHKGSGEQPKPETPNRDAEGDLTDKPHDNFGNGEQLGYQPKGSGEQPTSVEAPMGVSQWREHGKRYGYWRYFAAEERRQAKIEATEPFTDLQEIPDGTHFEPCQICGQKSHNCMCDQALMFVERMATEQLASLRGENNE